MTMPNRLVAGLIVSAFFGAMLPAFAAAQVPSPPQTIIGSVADEAGPVPEGLTVEAYVADKLCGTGATELVGEGSPKTTVYYVDVFSRAQTPGCGDDGVEVKVKIGDRFAPQTARWRAGLLEMDVTFGNIQPAPIPTATPTQARAATQTPTPIVSAESLTPQPTSDPGTPLALGTTFATGTIGTATPSAAAAGTIPAGSPGAGSPAPLTGGVTSSRPAPGADDSIGGGGGIPFWGIVVIGLVIIAGAGGAVGIFLARARARANDDEMLLAPPGDQP